MKPLIFDGVGAKAPFTSECVKLDLTLSSTLKWNPVVTAEKVFWELDLGLFDRLAFDLTSESQVRTLGLGLQHFADTLLKSHPTEGVSLWRGTLDFQKSTYHESPYERRDVVLDFVEQLSYFLPEELPVYILLDARQVTDPIQQMLLADPGKRGRVGFALRGMRVPTRDLIWEESFCMVEPLGYIGTGTLEFGSEVRRALFLPKEVSDLDSLRELYELLEREQVPYRLVGEESFTGEWDGLDELFVKREMLSKQALRKLAAFEAAGGVVLDV